jgi:hypothetical protein
MKEVKGHTQICIIFTSDDAVNMKLDWAYASGLIVDYANRILVYYDEDGMAYNCGGIDLELCVFSTKHLKKKHDQEKMSDMIDIYNNILKFITATSNSKLLEFESEGLKYVPKNSKCKPIYLK